MNESELQEAIIDAARGFGWLVYHTHNSRRSEPGFPDLVMVNNRKVLFVELKAEKGRLSEPQKVWQERLRRVEESEYYLWRPKDLEDAVNYLHKQRTSEVRGLGVRRSSWRRSPGGRMIEHQTL